MFYLRTGTESLILVILVSKEPEHQTQNRTHVLNICRIKIQTLKGMETIQKYEINFAQTFAEIKEELESANSVKIEEIHRLQKFDQTAQKKIDTESIIIEFCQEVEFPFFMYFGYKRINVKEFIPYPDALNAKNMVMYRRIVGALQSV